MLPRPASDQADFPTGLETPELQTRLDILVQIRWMAISGQLATVAIVEGAIGNLPLAPLLGVIAASVLLNAILTFGKVKSRITETQAAWYLSFDILQLALMLGLTGGPTNPFAIFMLAPVAVGAAVLAPQRVAMLVGFSVFTLSAVAMWHLPLPITLHADQLYIFGAWMAMLLGVVSLAFFTWRMADESRNAAAAYSQARIVLAQEERMAEVGALAAAVAHEMNTPLATVCLLAREVGEQLPADSPVQSDLRMLLSQANRCRDTLARLTSNKGRNAAVEHEPIPLPSLVEMAAATHAETSPVPIFFDHHADSEAGDMPVPWVEHKLEILHGLSNLIQNAIQFAASRVEIHTAWNRQSYSVHIVDDGPGFAAHLLGQLGEPYISGRSESSSAHLGLGVFISKTLLCRTKATVHFSNLPEGGAEVRVTWPRQTANERK